MGYLLGRGEDAGSILGLTFSIKAAEEMRERIARIAPAEAAHMVIGTFHSFGLEVLRKYGHHLNYPKRLRVLDPASALFMMERMLPALGLVHYQNLYEPTSSLRDLLDAISRAKDELRTPDEYEVLARAMREKAADEEQVERAERALEVARVYRIYQGRLDAERMVDFGDLIFRTVELLRTVSAVRTVLANEFRNILVDEYQDVNRVSGALLEELAEVSGGRGLWVVGDARQSIYRWRGASSANMRLFRERFPQTKVKVLAGNYRSQPAVVDLVSSFAQKMVVGAGEPFEPWKANREDQGGRVLMEVASDGAAEAQNIAREIERRRREENVSYRSQAVLCRSHTQLARIAAGLERNGVPVLYLGDLFERTEIRDMLALLSLACEGRGRGLVRVARFPEYQIPDADVVALLRAAREREVPFPRALGLAAELDGMSDDGRAGLLKLRGQLDGLCYGSNAWGMVVRYLFERSAYIRLLAADVSVEGQQKRLALFQFLEFAHQIRELEAP
ncbi:MAG TPA: ATP-dependent helicase, partial [Longimicrobium sp.]|nr:ATP-dependent helicase [Longimicrobium sp.]